MIRYDLSDQLTLFVEDTPPSLLHACATAVGGAKTTADARSRVSDTITDAKKRSYILSLVQSCETEDDLTWLSVALEAMAKRSRKTPPDAVRLLWTGKDTVQSSRSLDQALLEVIKSAEKNLWLLSYVVYGADQAISAIRQQLQRGVRVQMVLEPSAASGGTLSHDSFDWLQKNVQGLELLWWPKERRTPVNNGHGALHAKAAVADRDLAVISSANLTGRAMDANLELGVLLRGGRGPENLRKQLDRMREAGVFVPFRSTDFL